MKNNKPIELLYGEEYLSSVRNQEEKCRLETKVRINSFGENLPALEKNIGTLLSLFEYTACCGWGCAENGHTIESLIGRAYGLASGAYRLMQFGRYDESMLLIRALGEITNLLTLFATNTTSQQEWLAGDEKIRNKNFSPFKVRISLENRKIQIPMDHVRYKYLSSITAHPAPGIKPGMYNHRNLSVLGGHAQLVGIVIVLNELANILGCAAIVSVSLLEIPIEIKEKIRTLGSILLSDSILLSPEDIKQLYLREPPLPQNNNNS